MKFIYILEDDGRVQKDLFDTLKSIDPQLAIRYFENLEEFHEWLKAAVQEGPKALAKGGHKFQDDISPDIEPASNHELRLVIAKNEFLGTQNMGLVKRARDFFLRKNMCTQEEPTALVLTAFDSPDFDISLAEERIINNVIFKPFDKLILKQHLEYALIGNHPVKTGTVASFQVAAKIEMLKEVNINTLTEMGFTTVNNHEIKIGAITKYYSDVFKTDAKKSVLAYCYSCKKLNENEFLCEFHFFAADNQQISQIRRQVLQNKDHAVNEVQNPTGPPRKVLIVDEDVPLGTEIKSFLTEKMDNAEIYLYSSMGQLLSDLADKDTPNKQTLPSHFDIVISNYSLFEVEREKRWEQMGQFLKDRAKAHQVELETLPDLFLLCRKKLQFDELKEFSAFTKEIFFTNLDKVYMLKKLVLAQPGFHNKSPISVASIEDNSILKVANPVEVSQISEAGVIIKYYRAISTGAFREFILWRPQELEIPEIIGTVNYTEVDKSSGETMNHFVFFGMTDHYLKHLRLWLLDTYIKGKDKSA